ENVVAWRCAFPVDLLCGDERGFRERSYTRHPSFNRIGVAFQTVLRTLPVGTLKRDQGGMSWALSIVATSSRCWGFRLQPPPFLSTSRRRWPSRPTTRPAPSRTSST